MRVKIYKGSVQNSGTNLCETCRYSTITRGRTLDEEFVRCDAATMQPIVIRFKVTACSAYADQTAPSYGQFLQQAWILQPASAKRPAGFVRSIDLSPQELHSLVRDAPDNFD